jgi:hypothetical protein
MAPTPHRTHSRFLTLIFCLTVGAFLVLSSTGAAWAGSGHQTIPTVTATIEGQPPVTLPDGLVPINPGEGLSINPALQFGFWPIGCCLMACLVGLIPLGVLFNVWARRRKKQAATK